MKRLVWLLLITVLLSTMLCACTNDSPTTSIEGETSTPTDANSTLETTDGMEDGGTYDDGHTWDPVK